MCLSLFELKRRRSTRTFATDDSMEAGPFATPKTAAREHGSTAHANHNRSIKYEEERQRQSSTKGLTLFPSCLSRLVGLRLWGSTTVQYLLVNVRFLTSVALATAATLLATERGSSSGGKACLQGHLLEAAGLTG